MPSTGANVDNTGSMINLFYRFVKYNNYSTFLHGMFLNLCITLLFTAKPYPHAKYLMETILQGSVYAYFGFTIGFITNIRLSYTVSYSYSDYKFREYGS